MYEEQLPPEDQRVQEASTKLPKINSPGTSANRQMNISWVGFPDCQTFPQQVFLIESFWTRHAIYLDAHAQSLVLLIYTANVNQEVSNLYNVDWLLFFAFES